MQLLRDGRVAVMWRAVSIQTPIRCMLSEGIVGEAAAWELVGFAQNLKVDGPACRGAEAQL